MKKVETKDKRIEKASPAEREMTGIGIPAAVVAKSVNCLNRVLANAYILQIKTKKCHWDVSGPQFMTLHKMLDEQYAVLDEFADMAAERVRMLGAFPAGTAAGFLELTDLYEQPTDIPTATDVVLTLCRDHETVARVLRESIESSEDGDVGTADMFTEMLRKHEELAWMLRAFVHGEAIKPGTSTQTLTQKMSVSRNERRTERN